MTAAEAVARLQLEPHPEGGWFRETFRDALGADGRSASTAIYFLLEEGRESAWHRVIDAVEIFHFYAGAPMELRIAPYAGGSARTVVLGPDVTAGEQPQVVIPVGDWQRAASLGAWSLVGCTVAPGFEFSAFELAPEGWGPEL
jgi:predicted cupin superfamily sugar epimerase